MFATLLPALIGLLAVAAAVASVVFFVRARQREDAGTDAGTAAADGLVEMRALGQRIETLVGQQQLQGETARQHLAQKLDAVGENVEQQRHHVHGLQNELRHEVRRRDAEMDELRTQLESIQRVGPAAPRALPPALPPAPAFETPAFDIPAFSPAEPFAVAPFAAAPFAAPTGDGLAATFGDAALDDGWDTGAPAPFFSDPFADDTAVALPAAAPEAPAPPAEARPVAPFVTADPFADEPAEAGMPGTSMFEPVSFGGASGFAFEDFAPAGGAAAATLPAWTAAPAAVPVARPAPPSETAWVALAGRPAPPPVLAYEPPPAFEMPSFEMPSLEVPSFEVPSFETPAADVPALTAAQIVVTPSPPAGADDLTVISTIDEPTQQILYAAGVTTLDDIARWGRSDARRIAAVASISEDTILNQWVFEAQSALFQSYSAPKAR